MARRVWTHDSPARRTSMTSAIGVAKVIIANRPIASDTPQAPSQATFGFRKFIEIGEAENLNRPFAPGTALNRKITFPV